MSLVLRTLLLSCILCLFSSSMTNASLLNRIASSAETVTPLLNGQFIPDVMVQNGDGKDISLKKLIESKPSVVIFYRGGWCPYCNRQFKDLVDVEQRIIDLGYQIIAISPDPPERLQEQKMAGNYNVVRISDNKLQAIQAFGLGYFLADDMADKYRDKLGANLVSRSGENKVVLPVPAAYVFDTSGLVQFQYVNPNFRVRISPLLLFYAAQIAK